MITLFDFLEIAGVICGGCIGFRLGELFDGNVGGVIGIVGGCAIGWILGHLPFITGFWFLRGSFKRANVPDLRSRLERDYFISHLIIAELLTRGEPVESFRSVVEQQLASPSADV